MASDHDDPPSTCAPKHGARPAACRAALRGGVCSTRLCPVRPIVDAALPERVRRTSAWNYGTRVVRRVRPLLSCAGPAIWMPRLTA